MANKNGLRQADTIAARIQNWIGAIGLILAIVVYAVLIWVQVNKNTSDIDDLGDNQRQMVKDMEEVINKRDKQIKEDKKIINDLENRIIILETKEKDNGK